MSTRRKQILLPVCLLGLILAVFCGGESEESLTEKIITKEQAALDRWGKGDPFGFIEAYADEITYFDPGTEQRVDGLEKMKQLLAPLKGEISIERYEMINPKVQIHGNTAILTYNLIDFSRMPDGSIHETRWNSTEVYNRIDGEWKVIHNHWSYIRPLPEDTP